MSLLIYRPPIALLAVLVIVATEFHYDPDSANDTIAQSLLSEFLQSGDTVPLSIKHQGRPVKLSVFITSPGIRGVSLTTSLAGFYATAPPIHRHINVYVPLSAIVDSLVSIGFDVIPHQHYRCCAN